VSDPQVPASRKELKAEFEALCVNVYGFRPLFDDEANTYRPSLMQDRWNFFQVVEAARPMRPVEPTEKQVLMLDPWVRPEAARELLRKVLAA
jgi:hypothetical protein